MVSDLREKAKEMMRGYEKACKEKKVIKAGLFLRLSVRSLALERKNDSSGF